MSRTPYTPIAEGSQATPGLWNAIFSAISTDLDVVLSPTTSTFSSSVTVTGQVTLVGPLSVQSGPVYITDNSNSTDYLFLTDSSNQRSNYALGSKSGGFADGLVIYDTSGATSIVNFSKQSVRFFAPVVGVQFDQGGTVYNVKAYGAKGDGVTDDSTVIETVTGLAGGGAVFFSAGTYLVTRPLVLPKTFYKWLGVRNERAVGGAAPGQPLASIKYRPSTTTRMITILSLASDQIGPFEHENLLFDAQEPNNSDLFAFGDETISFTTGGQADNFGVRFDKCKLLGNYAATSSSSTGVVTRTGQTLIRVSKAYETVLNECRIQGGDTQVKLFGCEKPLLSKTWMLYGNVALDIVGNGTYFVQNALTDVQFNAWTLAAIKSTDGAITCSNFRFERGSLGTGGDWYQLVNADGSASTVSCSINTRTLAFGRDMTNVLFPDLSVIKLNSGQSTFVALVRTVSGNTVTFYDTNNVLTWAASAATVMRLHGYGIIHNSIHDGTFVNGSVALGANSPPFIYAVNNGMLFAANVSEPYGAGTLNSTSLIIGNKLVGLNYLDCQAGFAACSPFIVPDPSNPFVHVSNIRSDQGQRLHPVHGSTAFDPTRRARVGPLDSDAFYGRRRWAWTPKSYSAFSADAPYALPLLQVPGEVGTLDRPWVWAFGLSFFGANLQLTDESLSTQAPIRLAFRARAAAANATLRWRTRSGANIDSLQTVTLTSTWTTVESYMTTPPAWTGSNRSTVATGIEVLNSPDNEFWVAAATVDELPNAVVLGTDGTSIAPTVGFASEQSLGWYRSAASVMQLSYGTLKSSQASIGGPLLLGDGTGLGDGGYFRIFENSASVGIGTSPVIVIAGPAGGSGASVTKEIHFKTYGGTVASGILGIETVATAGSERGELFFATRTGTGNSLGTEKFRVGQFGAVITDGAALAPTLSFKSELSLGIYRSAASTLVLSYGTIDLTASGAMTSIASLKIKAGANNSCGTAVLGSNGSVNVANTYVKTGDLIFLTDQTPGGTLGDLEMTGIRNSSGFTIASTSVTDTSTVAWLIIRPG